MSNFEQIRLPQFASVLNSKVITAADAQPGNPWIGGVDTTRARGIVGVFLSVIAPGQQIGGTYTFEFSDDGVTWPISIAVHVRNLSTIRFRQLLDVRSYYRTQFEPDEPLGAGFVVLDSQFATQADPPFVVPAGHVFEEEDAAFGATWSFGKAFVEETGDSVNIRATARGDQFMVDRSRDSSLTGETVNSAWYPEITASFNDGLPSDVHETTNTGGVTTDFTEHQLKVTVPPGGTYIVATRQQSKYTNGQETRALGTTAFETAPAAGHRAILWALSRDQTSGFGIGHHNGQWVFARRFDNVTSYVNRADWSNDDKLTNPLLQLVDANFQAPQINRLRMLYLGYGPLAAEVRNIKLREVDPWATMHVEHFINDPTSLLPNLSNPDLGMALEIVNTGSGNCIVRTNSWGVGPVVGDIGEQQPDGDRIFPRADGVAVDQDGNALEYNQSLSPSQTITTGVVDTDGQNQLEIFIETNQVSAGDGVKVYYTDNAQADVLHFSPPVAFTVTAEDVLLGFAVFPISVNMDGFKVEYTNGGVAANFRMVVTLRKPSRPLSQRMMTGQVQKTDPGVVNWARLFGYNDAGAFKAPATHNDGWTRVSVKAHESRTPPRPCDDWKITKTTLTTTAVDIIAAGSALASRVSFEVYNADSTKDIHIGTSTATVTAGQFRTIAPGQGIVLELKEGVGLAGKSATGSCSVEVTEIADTTSSG